MRTAFEQAAIAALEAACRYDDAIAGRGEDGDVELNPLGAIAQGVDLDTLYFDWINKSRHALSLAP
jgi:hypothetical protein